jgi:hypothetical protein
VNVEERGGNVEDNLHTFNPFLGKALNSNVEDVEVFTPSTETSKSSMMSCTTESVEPPIALADNMRSALVSADREAAHKVWRQLKNDKAAQENLKKQLTEEENINVRLLLNCGFVRGLRVSYVGTKYVDQYAGLELVVDGISNYSEIACVMPDGSFTTWLDPKDLEVAD